MAQKFISLEEAATQLGISKDRLNELREDGKVRGIATARVGNSAAKISRSSPPKAFPRPTPEQRHCRSIWTIDLDDRSLAEVDRAALPIDERVEPTSSWAATSSSTWATTSRSTRPAASDLSLDDVDEPTVPVERRRRDDEVLRSTTTTTSTSLSDSILLSETELGESTDRPPSTIIGKAELDVDLDLDLSPSERRGRAERREARAAGTSNVFIAARGDDDLGIELPSPSGNFEDLEELEVDLEAESSRILSPEDVAKAQASRRRSRSQGAPRSATSNSRHPTAAPAASTRQHGRQHRGDIGAHRSLGAGTR